ncbi:MAG TPA: PstS family phosphate ABC transporter substrate-binding protein [Longimicrobiales bacterium]|jgi:phosphate transport system substrate-binding protein
MSVTIRLALSTIAIALLSACGSGRGGDTGPGSGSATLAGSVDSDGSSTVFPVAEAVAEEFQIRHPGVRVTVGVSGTGGGFKRFCAGETDISNASRRVDDSEIRACEARGVDFVELRVAWDGLSVVTNPAADFLQCLTMDELRRIWGPGSSVLTWRDVRSEWPAEVVRLYGPGTDSGTFDFFTETVNGRARASRTDFQASEDDNILVQGVAGDRGSLGYIGFAYFVENREALKLVGVDAGGGCVLPGDDTIEDGTYPLARPLFVYVRRSALVRPEVLAYVRFFMETAADLVPATGYHPLEASDYRANLRLLDGA